MDFIGIIRSLEELLYEVMSWLIFATIPRVIAVIGMRGGGTIIDRKTLRRPFYSQCFLVASFALMLQSALAV